MHMNIRRKIILFSVSVEEEWNNFRGVDWRAKQSLSEFKKIKMASNSVAEGFSLMGEGACAD